MKSDLSAVSDSNVIFKYADDTTLLVAEHIDVSIDIDITSDTGLSLKSSSSVWTKQKKLSSDVSESSTFTSLLVLRTLNIGLLRPPDFFNRLTMRKKTS